MPSQSVTPKSTATAVTLAAALLAIAIPVLLAIYLADGQARDTEMRVVTSYAIDVLHRSETTSNQVLTVNQTLLAAQSVYPCSDSNIAIMRRFDLSSSYLQDIGYVANGRLVCSSQGRDAGGLALGPVDRVTPAKVRVRINVRFPFDPATSYLVTESPEGFGAIINKDLPLDAATNETDASLSIFATINGRIMAAHGFVDPRWVGPPASTLPHAQAITTFVDHDHVVAVVRSNRY